ncbi:MAG: HNH endonuclease [Bacteroidales bacterium]
MRPVNKGENNKVYVKYQDAKRDLVNHIGNYCSYCERQIQAQSAIEHVIPKSLNKELELSWCNFLIACVNCNSIKGNKEVNIEEYVWPDKHNTFDLVCYSDNTLKVTSSSHLSPDSRIKVDRLISLVGLDRISPKTGARYEQMTDTRQEERLKCQLNAKRMKVLYENSSEKKVLLACMIDVIKMSGFWSIWMNVFQNTPEIKAALLNSFPGTAIEYFE